MSFQVNERSSTRYVGTLKDQAGAVVGASQLTALRLWLRATNAPAGVYIRNNQNVLNANGVEVFDTVAPRGVDANGVAVSGNIVWDMDPADNRIVAGDRDQEDHEAVFKYNWGSGSNAKQHTHRVPITVTNFVPIT